MSRISWAALMSLVFLLMAIVWSMTEYQTLALVLGMGSISWALLSLKEL